MIPAGCYDEGSEMSERILVVDDDEYSRGYLAILLRASDYETFEAVDGQDAYEKAVATDPDLILMDIVMPRLDGFQACALIKAEERFADTPIIFLSSKSDTEDKIKGLDIGGVDYITKPFDEGEVLARVRSQLKIRGLTKELRQANEKLTAKQLHLDEDLKAAGEIQRSMLPAFTPHLGNATFGWKFHPSDQVGGDIFNVIPLDNDLVSFYVLDVSGHGAPSALVAVSVTQILQSGGNMCLLPGVEKSNQSLLASPVEVLSSLDREFPIERFDRYFTMFYGCLNVHTGELVYSAAAHPPPLLLRADGRCELLEEGGSIIGLVGKVPFTQGTVRLEPGDRLFMYTDGITEYEDAQGNFFGRERLFGLVKEHGGDSLDRLLDTVYESLMQFGQERDPKDDVTMLALDFGPSD